MKNIGVLATAILVPTFLLAHNFNMRCVDDTKEDKKSSVEKIVDAAKNPKIGEYYIQYHEGLEIKVRVVANFGNGNISVSYKKGEINQTIPLSELQKIPTPANIKYDEFYTYNFTQGFSQRVKILKVNSDGTVKVETPDGSKTVPINLLHRRIKEMDGIKVGESYLYVEGSEADTKSQKKVNVLSIYPDGKATIIINEKAILSVPLNKLRRLE